MSSLPFYNFLSGKKKFENKPLTGTIVIVNDQFEYSQKEELPINLRCIQSAGISVLLASRGQGLRERKGCARLNDGVNVNLTLLIQ